MLNITELENKHKQYQSKILIHKLKIIVPVGLLSVFLIYFLTSDSTPKSKKIAPPKVPQAIVVEEQKDTITEVASQEILDEEVITEIEDEDIDKKVFAEIASQEIIDEEANKEVVTQTTSQETVAQEAVAQTTLQEVPKNNINKNIIAQTALQEATNPDINKKIVTKKTTPKIVLKPSFSFLDTIEVEEKKNIQSKAEPKTEPKKIIKKTPSKPRTALDRKKYKKSSLKSLLKKFKTNKDNSTISLFIAKKYYDIADYKKAYKYALVTNDIDNNINEAWIILAKSLVKLNQKSTAMYLLITYIRKSYSPQAKILLEDIKSGRFHE
jgi:hypothetical protein